ncbi:hypothetical protein HOLleu_39577 [Holothuria leucospilota]|uniref:TNFR-Cys domain-containing protein n=1 Tax=Holothuria leucospilota TaxID=206669 RepID=A0A9Q0YGP3_HOLLE|nr:hypothetical protein HOLleu_39577 [Holothuria leucospilota]
MILIVSLFDIPPNIAVYFIQDHCVFKHLQTKEINMIAGICFKLIPVLFVSLIISPYTRAQEHEEQYGAVCNITENEACFSNDTFSACSPGFHKNNIYTLCDNDRSCCPCPTDTYQPWWNECNSCILCTDCSEMNKETLHYCNITHNSVCGKELYSTVFPAVTVHTPQSTTVPTQTTTPGEEISITESPEPPDDEPKDPVYKCPSTLIKDIITHVVCILVPLIIFLRYPDVARNIHDRIKSIFSSVVACLTSSNNNQKAGTSDYDLVGRGQ